MTVGADSGLEFSHIQTILETFNVSIGWEKLQSIAYQFRAETTLKGVWLPTFWWKFLFCYLSIVKFVNFIFFLQHFGSNKLFTM